MAITFARVKVSNPARPKKAGTHRFLVDFAAYYSVMPASDLKSIGIVANSFEDFLTATGETVRQLRGQSTSQVESARVGLVISGPMVTPVSSMLLGTEDTL